MLVFGKWLAGSSGVCACFFGSFVVTEYILTRIVDSCQKMNSIVILP